MTAGRMETPRLTDTSRGGLAELADFCADRRRGAHPAAVVEKARACLLYGLSVGIGSAHAELPWKVARAVDRLGAGGGPARRLLDGRALAPDAAAFANGSLLHARIQEDAHPAGHVGVVVLPPRLQRPRALPPPAPTCWRRSSLATRSRCASAATMPPISAAAGFARRRRTAPSGPPPPRPACGD